jgi:hypothetical protein
MSKTQFEISVMQTRPISGEKAYTKVIKMLEDRISDDTAVLNLLRDPQIKETYISVWSPTALINEFIVESEDS